jgi:hypothetical protein
VLQVTTEKESARKRENSARIFLPVLKKQDSNHVHLKDG